MMRVLSCCLMITALVFISCSSSNDPGPTIQLQSGTYQVNEQESGSCADPGGETDNYQLQLTVSGSSVTIYDPVEDETLVGTISGNTVTVTPPPPFAEDGGTVTVSSITVTITSTTSFTGSINYSWTDGSDSCTGFIAMQGNKT